MWNFIERMRGESRQKKLQYSFWGACLVTVVIGSIWVSTLPARFSGESEAEQAAAGEAARSGFGELFDSVRKQAGSVVDSVTTEDTDTEQNVVLEDDVERDAAAGPGEMQNEATTSIMQQHMTGEEGGADSDGLSEGVSTSSTSTPREPRVILIGTTSSQKAENLE